LPQREKKRRGGSNRPKKNNGSVRMNMITGKGHRTGKGKGGGESELGSLSICEKKREEEESI